MSISRCPAQNTSGVAVPSALRVGDCLSRASTVLSRCRRVKFAPTTWLPALVGLAGAGDSDSILPLLPCIERNIFGYTFTVIRNSL